MTQPASDPMPDTSPPVSEPEPNEEEGEKYDGGPIPEVENDPEVA